MILYVFTSGRKVFVYIWVWPYIDVNVCVCVQSVRPWRLTSSGHQSSSLSRPSASLSSRTLLPRVLDVSVEISSVRDRTPVCNLRLPPPPPPPPPPLHTARPAVRPQIPVDKTQTPVRYTHLVLFVTWFRDYGGFGLVWTLVSETWLFLSFLLLTLQMCLHSASSPDWARVCSLGTTRTASPVRPALSLTSAPPTWSSYRRKIRRLSGIYTVSIFSCTCQFWD